jgi:hypothetical protein
MLRRPPIPIASGFRLQLLALLPRPMKLHALLLVAWLGGAWASEASALAPADSLLPCLQQELPTAGKVVAPGAPDYQAASTYVQLPHVPVLLLVTPMTLFWLSCPKTASIGLVLEVAYSSRLLLPASAPTRSAVTFLAWSSKGYSNGEACTAWASLPAWRLHPTPNPLVYHACAAW